MKERILTSNTSGLKYSKEVTISGSLGKVIGLFDNPAHMSEWQTA